MKPVKTVAYWDERPTFHPRKGRHSDISLAPYKQGGEYPTDYRLRIKTRGEWQNLDLTLSQLRALRTVVNRACSAVSQ